jgi:hypothetical protein
MGLGEQQAIAEALVRARADLAQRLGLSENEIIEGAVEQAEFPDAALGAPIEDEMSAQMITPGWRINLRADGKTYEYRANARQLRVFNFDGENYRV